MNEKVLFVDDDPALLEELRRLLRPLQGEWEMAFVHSGAEALETLAARPFDVVISDTCMPEMSGVELLAKVRQHYPKVVRVILSDCANEELKLKSVRPAHQYLAKPCDVRAIKAMVGRACALRNLLSNEALQRLVTQLQSLPSLPSLYTVLVGELQSPNTSAKKIGGIISQDLGMTAKILQMVNSAFFGVRRHVSSPAEAVNLLGLETVTTLVLTIQVFSQFRQGQVPGFSPNALWNHSLRVGLFAKRIAQNEGQQVTMANDAFTAGLLHDAGHLVLAANLPKLYAERTKLIQTHRLVPDEAELQVFGATHAEVGAYLLGLWGLPDAIVETVAFHHHPRRCLVQGFGPLTAVHAGNVLVHGTETQSLRVETCAATLDLDYLKELGLLERLSAWREICRLL